MQTNPNVFMDYYAEAYLHDKEWTQYIPAKYVQIFNDVRFTPIVDDSPVHTCARCSRTDVTYAITDVNSHQHFTSRNFAESGFCRECSPRALVAHLADFDEHARVMQELWHNVQLSMIFPDELFPSVPGFEAITCLCNSIAFLPSEAFPNPNYRVAVVALDKFGEKHHVHDSCSRMCEECGINFITSRYSRDGIDFPTFCGLNTRCRTCVNDLTRDESFVECQACQSIEHEDNITHSDIRNINLCRECYQEGIYCEACDRYWYEGSGHTDCVELIGSPRIYSYSYKPEARFYGEGDFHMGFELEVEYNKARDYDCDCDPDYDHDCDSESDHDDATDIVHNALGPRVYMKDDGSLDNGFEIVTHPHTLAEYQNNFDWSWLRGLVNNGYVSWNNSNCGLHVHVSRTAFALDHNGLRHSHSMRFNKFIYDNQELVERIAGRKSNHYASFTDKGHIISKVRTQNQENGRYEVVNVGNRDTYEIRIFRGSLRRERVLSAIEFTHATVEYTRDLKVSAKHNPFGWTRFVAFVMNHTDKYPNLSIILSEMLATTQSREN